MAMVCYLPLGQIGFITLLIVNRFTQMKLNLTAKTHSQLLRFVFCQ